jgi:ABC-2 type transport system permease protein
MRLSQSWIITAKDFKTYRKKKNIIYALAVVPTMVTILFPAVLEFAGHKNGASGIPAAELVVLLPSFAFFYVILAAYLPTPIASYTMVGEKVEKSLEPLLATPTTDSEILFGKGLGAFIPPLAAILIASLAFMGITDLVTHSELGYYYFPNWASALRVFALTPLATLMSVQLNVIVSSRISDVRTSQQVGALSVLPFAGIYLGGELNIINLGSTENLLVITGAVLAVDALLFFVTKVTFRREEILTKWK